jgi:hypothetical protein
MTLDLFWADFWIQDRLFGFGLCTLKGSNFIKSLFSIYWNDRELLVDLFWIRILTYTVLIGYKEPNE